MLIFSRIDNNFVARECISLHKLAEISLTFVIVSAEKYAMVTLPESWITSPAFIDVIISLAVENREKYEQCI